MVAAYGNLARRPSALLCLLNTLPHIQVIGEAEDGEGALQLVTELDPDLLLLDVCMPKLDGLEVLAHLRAIHARVQVVVLSAEMEQFVLFWQESGVAALVNKGNVTYLIQILLTLRPD